MFKMLLMSSRKDSLCTWVSEKRKVKAFNFPPQPMSSRSRPSPSPVATCTSASAEGSVGSLACWWALWAWLWRL